VEIVRLGRTGLKVSRICLGTMTFGVQCDEAQSRAILDHAADRGVSFIDTADGYPLLGNPQTVGMTEEILGRWLAGITSPVPGGWRLARRGWSPGPVPGPGGCQGSHRGTRPAAADIGDPHGGPGESAAAQRRCC